jgi:hypothetical protein
VGGCRALVVSAVVLGVGGSAAAQGPLITRLTPEGTCAHLACCGVGVSASVVNGQAPEGFFICPNVPLGDGRTGGSLRCRLSHHHKRTDLAFAPAFSCTGQRVRREGEITDEMKHCNTETELWLSAPRGDCSHRVVCAGHRQWEVSMRDHADAHQLWEASEKLISTVGGARTSVHLYRVGNPAIAKDPECIAAPDGGAHRPDGGTGTGGRPDGGVGCNDGCADRSCGPDPCGRGSCGRCSPPAVCNEYGQCESVTTCISCQDVSCGPDPCGGLPSCGNCPRGYSCNDLGECESVDVAICGDGRCEHGETSEFCPEDCGRGGIGDPCSGDGSCASGHCDASTGRCAEAKFRAPGQRRPRAAPVPSPQVQTTLGALVGDWSCRGRPLLGAPPVQDLTSATIHAAWAGARLRVQYHEQATPDGPEPIDLDVFLGWDPTQQRYFLVGKTPAGRVTAKSFGWKDDGRMVWNGSWREAPRPTRFRFVLQKNGERSLLPAASLLLGQGRLVMIASQACTKQ